MSARSKRSRTAVLVVDMQLDFYSRNAAVSAAFPSLPVEIGRLLNGARTAGDVEVVHLREGSNSAESPWYTFWQRLNPGLDSSADPNGVEPCAAALPSEAEFVKFGYDGVGVDCGLVSHLLSVGVGRVLVCGLVTSCCVHMNAAGLFLRGFEVFVVPEACGDRTEKMSRESLQRESRRSYGVLPIASALQLLDDPAAVDPFKASWPNATQFEK